MQPMARFGIYFGAVLMLLASIASAGLFPVFAGDDGERSIQIKGVFVLVDESSLLDRIKRVSMENPERQQFVDEVYRMLNHEPLIASSTLRYSWPNEVEIEIREINPIARVNTSSLMLADCRVIESISDQLPVRLIDILMEKKALDIYRCEQLKKILSVITQMPVNRVTVLQNHDYILGFDDRRIFAASANIIDNPMKVKKVVELMRAGKLDAEYVDMRYASGLAIRKVVNL
jgi:cell division septal protein FtsQ